ncbi:MAG TPA: PQQ-dependent sugar dehydrogenase [Nitrososphaeraceae archaeon]|nr:PQQ-dependent sugar dehydrogenase [Nitrososphaeraceae archaeon]
MTVILLQLIVYSPTLTRAEPVVNDPSLKVELLIEGIKFPTSMAFLGPDDILFLEKNQGTVKRIVNGNVLSEPLLDVNVANKNERGMLGIAISQKDTKEGDRPVIDVFLYYTETKTKDGEDLEKAGSVLGNRLYKYELVNDKLVNPKLLLDLPAEPGSTHAGGVVIIGPDNNLYLIIGTVDHSTEAENTAGAEADGTGGILRVTQDGKPVGKGILGEKYPLNLYYAYGIRNGYGLDFDLVTGNLWDTENGLDCCDEINLVKPGFNSGWDKVQGIWDLNESKMKDHIFQTNDKKQSGKVNLVTFDGKGKYSAPEFTWNNAIGPSAVKFFTSDKLGKQYVNDMFVGNVNEQNIYHFDLTHGRSELSLNGTFADKISDMEDDRKGIIFADGLHRITDIEVGPDGNMYVLSHTWNAEDQYAREGMIYKISKNPD